MKRKLFVFVALFLLLICFTAQKFYVHADETAYYVYDEAGLLTDSEWKSLQDLASEVSSTYKCGVYAVTVEDFTTYTSDFDVLSAAENIYTGMDFGYGADKDGIMLLLSMADRDYALIAYGDFANYSFTDYGKDVLSDSFLPYFADNNWYYGFKAYINESENMLESASFGDPVDIWIDDSDYSDDYDYEPYKPTVRDYLERYVFMLFPGGVGSLLVCSILRSKSKTVRTATDADRYVRGGLNLRVANEIFLHRTQTRRRIEMERTQSHVGGHGGHFGGTTINSSGFSGKSGKF